MANKYSNIKKPVYRNPFYLFSTNFGGKDIDIFEDGYESRDFVYIDDVVNATILALKKETPFSGVFNIGTGSSTSVKKVVDLLQTVFEKKVDSKVSGNYRIGDIRTNFADISRARRDLSFFPEVKFSEGLKRFSQWVIAQKNMTDSDTSYEKSLDEMRERGLLIERR